MLTAVGPDAAQVCTATLVGLLPQVVAVQALPAAAAIGVHDATPVGPVVAGAGQVVAVQLFADVAAAAVQLATGTAVVTIGAGQVVVVQLLPAVAVIGEQLATGTPLRLLVPQVVVV